MNKQGIEWLRLIIISLIVIPIVIIVFLIGVIVGNSLDKKPVQVITPEYLTIAKDLITNQTYVSGINQSDITEVNNCVNFSTRLMNAYEEHNYESRIVTGYLNDQYCKITNELWYNVPTINEEKCKHWAHAWVEVKINGTWIGIEATQGKVVY